MGTLHSQPLRDVSKRFFAINEALCHMGVCVDDATPAEWHAACDIVRTALAVQSADVLDEQLSGFGHILESIAHAIQNNGADDVAAALNTVARSIFKLGLGDAATSMGALEAHGVHMGEIVGGISSALSSIASAIESRTEQIA